MILSDHLSVSMSCILVGQDVTLRTKTQIKRQMRLSFSKTSMCFQSWAVWNEASAALDKKQRERFGRGSTFGHDVAAEPRHTHTPVPLLVSLVSLVTGLCVVVLQGFRVILFLEAHDELQPKWTSA